MSETLVAPRAPGAPAAESAAPAPPIPGRLLSLDVFRGITIAAMLLVNNPGTWAHVYPPLRHAEWHGWTPTDLIFPFFLFIVGVAMSFSFGRMREGGVTRGAVLGRAGVRGAKLVGLGLLLHAFPWWGVDLGTLRLPGVLQRIGIAFVVAAAVVLWTDARARAGVTAALLLGYWALLSWVPVPGVGAGVLEPGRDLGAWLDRSLLGTDHLWAQSRTWDPEGLLSTLPAVATVLLGVFAGDWLRSERSTGEKVRGLLLAGVAGVALGSLWGLAFPINKPLWTSSYVILTAGLALLGLAFCYWSVDLRGHRRWSLPFLVFGMNAIAAYFLSSLGARVIGMVQVGSTSLKGRLFETLFATWLDPVNASLAFALGYVLFWLGVMAVLYQRRIFWKV